MLKKIGFQPDRCLENEGTFRKQVEYIENEGVLFWKMWVPCFQTMTMGGRDEKIVGNLLLVVETI